MWKIPGLSYTQIKTICPEWTTIGPVCSSACPNSFIPVKNNTLKCAILADTDLSDYPCPDCCGCLPAVVFLMKKK